MPWIELDTRLRNHLKLIRFKSALRISKAQAVGHLAFLWQWTLQYSPTGDLAALAPAEISDAADWPGDSAVFAKALRDCGWLDADGRVHDWDDYGGRHLENLQADRLRKQRERDERRTRLGLGTLPPPSTPAAPALEKPTPSPTPEASAGHPPDVRRMSCSTIPDLTLPDHGGGDARARGPCAEVPDLKQAAAAVMADGIPADFIALAHADWMDNGGTNAKGTPKPWPGYVRTRWRYEGTEWRLGTHRGKKTHGEPAPTHGGPSLRAVQTYAREKDAGDGRATAYAASWFRHWEAKSWKTKDGRSIDWKVRFSADWAGQGAR